MELTFGSGQAGYADLLRANNVSSA